MKLDNRIIKWINVGFLIITAIINIIGYYKLPGEIATQFSLTGEKVNYMSKTIYLLGSFGIVLLLTLVGKFKEQEQKLKYLLVNCLIVVANIVMIVIQL